VSERRDRRRRTDLDLFVLALIADGVATAYELQTSAGLSQGATIPVLQRLLDAGFIERAEPGVRRRADHHVTREGRKILKDGWRELIEEGPSGDLDADIRVALLAIRAGATRRVATEFLRQSQSKKLKSARVEDSDQLVPLASWYRKLRSAAAGALTKGKSAAALAMAEALPRDLSRNTRQKKPGNAQRSTR
jgi:DNA-binding PadR family transcriptional regulator